MKVLSLTIFAMALAAASMAVHAEPWKVTGDGSRLASNNQGGLVINVTDTNGQAVQGLQGVNFEISVSYCNAVGGGCQFPLAKVKSVSEPTPGVYYIAFVANQPQFSEGTVYGNVGDYELLRVSSIKFNGAPIPIKGVPSSGSSTGTPVITKTQQAQVLFSVPEVQSARCPSPSH